MNSVDQHIEIYLDREFENDKNEDKDEIIYLDNRFYIKRVLNLKSINVRSLRQLYVIREKLKMQFFDRQNLELFVIAFYIFLSYFLFIDDFEMYKNMYRILKTFYLISICLNYNERRKFANVFIFFLKSHDVKLDNMIKIFYKLIQKLNRDVKLKIDKKEGMTMWAFNMTFLENMF